MSQQEKKYPRRFNHSKGFGDQTDYFEVKFPGEKAWLAKKDGTGFQSSWSEKSLDETVAEGVYIETFDHHTDTELREQIKTRDAILYLKGLLKETKAKLAQSEEENARLKAKLKEVVHGGT